MSSFLLCVGLGTVERVGSTPFQMEGDGWEDCSVVSYRSDNQQDRKDVVDCEVGPFKILRLLFKSFSGVAEAFCASSFLTVKIWNVAYLGIRQYSLSTDHNTTKANNKTTHHQDPSYRRPKTNSVAKSRSNIQIGQVVRALSCTSSLTKYQANQADRQTSNDYQTKNSAVCSQIQQISRKMAERIFQLLVDLNLELSPWSSYTNIIVTTPTGGS
jgi:hypothetical protein